MSEYVQALELRITDNAKQAVGGLESLAATLNRIRGNIGRKLGLGNVTGELTKFTADIGKVASIDNITKINKLASAIQRLTNATRGMSGLSTAVRKVEQAIGSTGMTGASSASGIRKSAVATAAPMVDTENIQAARQVTQGLARDMKQAQIAASQIRIETISAKPLIPASAEQIAARRSAYWQARNERWQVREFGQRMSMRDRLLNSRGLAADMLSGSKAAQAVLSPPGSVKTSAVVAEAQKQAAESMTAEQARALGAAFLQNNNAAGLAQMKLGAMREQLGRGIASGSMNEKQIAEAAMRIQRLEDAQRKAAEAAGQHKTALDSLKSALKTVRGAVSGLFKPLVNLGSQFFRIAKYRLFRAALREISEGFSVGLQNVREYSKAIGGLYAKDMQGLDNRLLQMKNSLGAMAASLVQTLIPVFQQLVSWVMSAANWINQIIALLSGRESWTKAVEVEAASDSLDDVKDSAAGASKAMKNLLADFDELNIIQSQSGNGSGGGSGVASEATDYTKMFEESMSFDSGVLGAFQWLKDNIPIINGLVATLAASLLGLKGPALLITFGIAESFSAGKSAGLSGEGLRTALTNSLPGMFATALGGAYLGWTAGGVGGALVGIYVGVAISFAATAIGWKQGQREAILKKIREEAWGDDSFSVEEIRQAITNLFSFDIYNTINLHNTIVSNIVAKKNELYAKMNRVFGTYHAMVGIGIENAKPEDLLKLKTDVETVVTDLNAILDDVKAEVGVLITGNIQMYDTDNEEMLKGTLDNLGGLQSYIQGIGNEIGRILAEGTKEEYENVLPGLMETLNKVTLAMTSGKAVGEALSNMELIIGKYDLSSMTEESFRTMSAEYQELQKSFRETAQKEGIDYQKTLYGVWYAMKVANEETPGTFTEEQIKKAQEAAEGFDVNKYVDNLYAQWFGEADSTYRAAYLEAVQNAMTRGEATNFGNMTGSAHALNEAFSATVEKVLGISLYDLTQNPSDWANDMMKNPEQAKASIEALLAEYVKALTGLTVEDLASAGLTAWDVIPLDTKRYLNAMFGGMETVVPDDAPAAVKALAAVFGNGDYGEVFRNAIASLYGIDPEMLAFELSYPVSGLSSTQTPTDYAETAGVGRVMTAKDLAMIYGGEYVDTKAYDGQDYIIVRMDTGFVALKYDDIEGTASGSVTNWGNEMFMPFGGPDGNYEFWEAMSLLDGWSNDTLDARLAAGQEWADKIGGEYAGTDIFNDVPYYFIETADGYVLVEATGWAREADSVRNYSFDENGLGDEMFVVLTDSQFEQMFGGEVTAPGAPSSTVDESGEASENDAEQNRLLGAINTLVQQIANKDFSVKLVPSAQFGRVVNQSVGMYERVRG